MSTSTPQTTRCQCWVRGDGSVVVVSPTGKVEARSAIAYHVDDQLLFARIHHAYQDQHVRQLHTGNHPAFIDLTDAEVLFLRDCATMDDRDAPAADRDGACQRLRRRQADALDDERRGEPSPADFFHRLRAAPAAAGRSTFLMAMEAADERRRRVAERAASKPVAVAKPVAPALAVRDDEHFAAIDRQEQAGQQMAENDHDGMG